MAWSTIESICANGMSCCAAQRSDSSLCALTRKGGCGRYTSGGDSGASFRTFQYLPQWRKVSSAQTRRMMSNDSRNISRDCVLHELTSASWGWGSSGFEVICSGLGRADARVYKGEPQRQGVTFECLSSEPGRRGRLVAAVTPLSKGGDLHLYG